MYVKPLSPIERDVFKIQDDPALPNKGSCFRYMVNRNYQIRGVLQIYGSRYQMRGACLRYRMSCYRQLRGTCTLGLHSKKSTLPRSNSQKHQPPLQHQQKTKPLPPRIPPPPAATAKTQRQPKTLPPPRSNSKNTSTAKNHPYKVDRMQKVS